MPGVLVGFGGLAAFVARFFRVFLLLVFFLVFFLVALVFPVVVLRGFVWRDRRKWRCHGREGHRRFHRKWRQGRRDGNWWSGRGVRLLRRRFHGRLGRSRFWCRRRGCWGWCRGCRRGRRDGFARPSGRRLLGGLPWQGGRWPGGFRRWRDRGNGRGLRQCARRWYRFVQHGWWRREGPFGAFFRTAGCGIVGCRRDGRERFTRSAGGRWR